MGRGVRVCDRQSVAAGLVSKTREWPSFVSRPKDRIGNRAITVKRPVCLPDTYPETATRRLSLPPSLAARGRELVDAIEVRATEKGRAARTKVGEGGGRFKTRAQLLAVDP